MPLGRPTLVAGAAVAGLCLCAALVLAARHPIHPTVALALVCLCTLVVMARPLSAWFLIPALMPVVDLAPFTGRVAAQESDLLVLACLAGLHAARMRDDRDFEVDVPLRRVLAVALLLQVPSLLAGLASARASADAYAGGYGGLANVLRVAKPLLYCALLYPPLEWLAARGEPVRRALAAGIVAGLGGFALCALWERMVLPGLFDLSHFYRVSGGFWEMHVGGGALDVYLALSLPFAADMAVRGHTRATRLAAGAVVVVGLYTVVMTLSRGLYVAAALGLVAMLLHGLEGRGWAVAGKIAGALALALLVALPFSHESRLFARWHLLERDIDARLAHWSQGIALLQGGGAWLAGLGMGRYPTAYRDHPHPLREDPGGFEVFAGPEPFMRLTGPQHSRGLAAEFGASQRVTLARPGPLRVQGELRAPGGAAQLYAAICERALIYELHCAEAAVAARPGVWQPFEATLDVSALRVGAGWLDPPMMLTVAASGVRQAVDLRGLRLLDAGGADLLRNGDLRQGSAHWLLTGRFHYPPWHLDSLYVELLVERGIAGLIGCLGCLLFALARVWRAGAGARAFERPLAAALVSVLALGAVSSVFDAARGTLLLGLLVLGTSRSGRAIPPDQSTSPGDASRLRP